MENILFDTLAFQCTLDIKLRWFQYRIINGILTTNTFLVKIGQSSDNKCTFCKECPETIQHLLAECKIVKNIWLQLQKWITRKLCIPFKLNNYHILFGTDIKESNYAANLLIIITKFCIYKKRCQKLYPSFIPLQREIEKYFKLEQFIFLKNQNNEQYENKWQV
jgi:hypothetical protein